VGKEGWLGEKSVGWILYFLWVGGDGGRRWINRAFPLPFPELLSLLQSASAIQVPSGGAIGGLPSPRMATKLLDVFENSRILAASWGQMSNPLQISSKSPANLPGRCARGENKTRATLLIDCQARTCVSPCAESRTIFSLCHAA
jgi:hypothetical protein